MITTNSIKKTTFLIGTLLLSVLSANADNIPSGLTPEMLLPQLTNMSPEAASLGKYGAFQVSEYSGAANVSIPLYTVKSGDVSFPINLYYDATGIKVEQDATMVGLGWNLSYGGMISHIVCGMDDFRETTGFIDFNQNYWKNKKPWSMDLPFTFEPNIEIYGGLTEGCVIYSDKKEPHCEEKLNLYARMASGYDSPDVYQASFCGHNISFVIDKRAGKVPNSDFYPIVILNDNSRKYKISYNLFSLKDRLIYGAGNGYPSSFTITDDKGFTYVFGTACSENINSFEGIDSYYLTKIYGPDGENGKSVVKFEYYDPIRISMSGSRPQSKSHQTHIKRIYNKDDIDAIFPGTSNESQSISAQYRNTYDRLTGNLTVSYPLEIGCDQNGHSNKMYPKRIITALDTIMFNLGTRTDLHNAKSISSITIKPTTGNAKKNISFNYEYFSEDHTSQSPTLSYQRLKLTYVKIDDQKYVFEYDESVKLPSFASYSKDYWGYYNGANPNDNNFVGCSPAYAISNGNVVPVQHLDGSNRLASEKLCKVGMLKKVTYPTGGYTLYEFEANRFNDKYYYPDASNSKISFPSAYSINESSIVVHDGSINIYGTMAQTLTIKACENKYDIKISAVLKDASDNLTVTIKNDQGSVVRYVTYNGSKNIGETISLSLSQDVTYTIEAKLTTKQANSTSSVASCYVTHDALTSPTITYPTASPKTKDENGGYSIGGGVRVKTIKNYDSDGTYLNGVSYEYSNGKLLSPTVQLEKHFIDFTYSITDKPAVGSPKIIHSGIPVRFSFLYANTEPSYPYICSLGIPATVGYDRVVKKEVDKNGNVLRKTVFNFHNYGYITDDGNMNSVNSKMQNSFYFNSYYGNNSDLPQGHLNGKIKNDTTYSNTGKIIHIANYSYYCTRQGSILYPKCLPLHINGFRCDISRYDLACFVKHLAWTYLTQKTETLYDKNGNKTTSNTTSFLYNSTNYQPSQQTVTDGLDSIRTNYWYPSDLKDEGYNELKTIHNISEVIAIDTYRNGTFTGGSKYSYVKKYSNASKKYFPVVYRCFSVLPNTSKSNVIEMTVTSWDGYGNIREYQKKDGTPVTVIWSYNHQLPIMEIVGCKYADACKLATSIPTVESQTNVSDNTIASIHSKLQNDLKDAYVTAYIYGPWHTVTQIIKPNGEKIQYCYDDYGRLKETKDVNDKTLQKYFYNYKNK